MDKERQTRRLRWLAISATIVGVLALVIAALRERAPAKTQARSELKSEDSGTHEGKAKRGVVDAAARDTSMASSTLTVTTAGSLDRYSPTALAPAKPMAALYSARGEYESFQIIVRSPTTGLTNVNVVAPDLTGPGGEVIPKASLALYREKYVYVSQPIPTSRYTNLPQGPGWYPDGLIPFNDPVSGTPLSNSGAQLVAVPFNLSANMNQGIWVDVFVPRTATPGVYTGVFVVTSDQGQASVTLSLTAWHFTLPLQPSLKSDFNYWAASQNRAAVVSQDTKNTNILLMQNRLMPATVFPPDESFYINNYGLTNTALPLWSGADAQNCAMSAAPAIASIKAMIAQNQPGLFVFAAVADEISSCPNLFPALSQWSHNLHQAGVSVLVTMPPTPALFSDGSGTGRSAVDIWTMLPMQFAANSTAISETISEGATLWSYNTLMQDPYSPKWLISYAPLNYRLHAGMLSETYNLKGLLYWRIDNWSSDPWNNVEPSVIGGYPYPGEGMLVYPGAQVGIVGSAPSMRLKYLRDGSDDYEYVEMLKKLGYGAWALQVAAAIAPDWKNWTRDPNALEAARIQLGEKLDQLSQ